MLTGVDAPAVAVWGALEIWSQVATALLTGAEGHAAASLVKSRLPRPVAMS